jgi:GT2 family glycosyltransferase
MVVDNGSTDETPGVLAEYPWVRVLALPRNLGFARAVNEGIRACRTPIVVLLNNDTVAEENWLAELLDALDAHPECGMATSKILTMADRRVLHTTGDTLAISGRPANRGVWETDSGQYDAAEDVFGASGAAGAYRRALFERVGLFEERFGSYLEDVDLAWRARLAGFGCVFVPTAVVYHHVSATGGGPYASYHVARNRIWLLARNYPSGLLRRHARRVAAGVAVEAVQAARAWRGAAARATLRGLAVGVLTWPRMLSARRRIQSRRVLPDAAFERLLDPS